MPASTFAFRGLAAFALVLPLAALAAPKYVAHPLVDPDGHDLQGTALNSGGYITGIANPNLQDGTDSQLAFIASAKTLHEFGDPAAFQNVPFGINASRDVVGVVTGMDNSRHAFVARDGQSPIDPMPGAHASYAYGVNGPGVVIIAADGAAFTWRSNGATIHIPTPAGDNVSEPTGINDAGVVVGESENGSNQQGGQHAWIWRDGVLSVLPGLTDAEGVVEDAAAQAINAAGLVVGNCMVEGYYHPCSWTNGVPHDLGLLSGGNQGYAKGVNDRGEIVGYSFASGRATLAHPVLWRHGVMSDLRKLVDLPPHQFLLTADAINDRGEILVSGYENIDFRTQVKKWWLLVPNAL